MSLAGYSLCNDYSLYQHLCLMVMRENYGTDIRETGLMTLSLKYCGLSLIHLVLQYCWLI